MKIKEIREKYPEYGGLSDDQLADALHKKFYSNTPRDIFNAKLMGVEDTKMGAPTKVRAAVGISSTEEDKLATLRKYYPDAEPVGDGNFVFTDPASKKKAVFNEENLKFIGIPLPTLGDVAEVAPAVAEMVGSTAGGIAGGALGTMAAPGVGTTVGAMGGMGAGALLGREGYKNIAGAFLGSEDTRTQTEKDIERGVTFGLNAVLPAALQKAGGALKGVVTSGAKRVIKGIPQNLSDAAYKASQRLGIDLPAGAFGNQGLQQVEQGFATLPGSADIVASKYSQAEEAMGGKAREIAESMGGRPQTAQGAGEIIQSGAKKSLTKFEETQERLYTEAYDKLGREAQIGLKNVMALDMELFKKIQSAPNTLEPTMGKSRNMLQSILQDAFQKSEGKGTIDLETLRNIRTVVGGMLKDPKAMASNGFDDATMKKLYGALTKDIFETAKSVNPEAAKLLKTADRYTRYNITQNAPTLEKIVGAATPESVYKQALSATKDGGTGLVRIKRNIPKDEWDKVSGSVFDALGKATPGQQGATELMEEAADWSASTFLTNWNKLSPEARKTLFGGKGNISKNIDDLVLSASMLKRASSKKNFSNTAAAQTGAAGIYAAMGFFAGDGDIADKAVSGAKYAATGILAPRYAAKLMQSPQFVSWLAETPKAAALSAKGWQSHLAKLYTISEVNPELRDAIDELNLKAGK